jgi:hypothetical protein
LNNRGEFVDSTSLLPGKPLHRPTRRRSAPRWTLPLLAALAGALLVFALVFRLPPPALGQQADALRVATLQLRWAALQADPPAAADATERVERRLLELRHGAQDHGLTVASLEAFAQRWARRVPGVPASAPWLQALIDDADLAANDVHEAMALRQQAIGLGLQGCWWCPSSASAASGGACARRSTSSPPTWAAATGRARCRRCAKTARRPRRPPSARWPRAWKT